MSKLKVGLAISGTFRYCWTDGFIVLYLIKYSLKEAVPKCRCYIEDFERKMVFPYTLHALVKERWLVWLCGPSGLRTRTTGLVLNFNLVVWWHNAQWWWLHLYTRRPTLRPRFSQALLPRLLINRFIWFPPGQPNRSWPWALRLAVRGFSSIEAVELGFVWVWYLPPLRIVRFPAPITKFIDAYP